MALTTVRGSGFDVSAIPSGGIIQTQYTQFTGTNTYSVTQDTETILTDLTVNITPNFTNSIIHLQAHIFCEFGVDDANMWNHTFYFLRDSTKLAHAVDGSRNVGISMATRTHPTADDNSTPEIARFDYFDTPSSTSQITYKVGLFITNSNETFTLNRSTGASDNEGFENGVSCIIAQEIAG